MQKISFQRSLDAVNNYWMPLTGVTGLIVAVFILWLKQGFVTREEFSAEFDNLRGGELVTFADRSMVEIQLTTINRELAEVKSMVGEQNKTLNTLLLGMSNHDGRSVRQ
jgi:hypothetical protein